MSYLELARKAKEEYRRQRQGDGLAVAKPKPPVVAVADPRVDGDLFRDSDIIARMLENDEAVAVLINSRVIGAPIWFALREGWKPEECGKTPVFYPSELPALRQKTAEQLRSIFNVKRAFGVGKVVQ